MSLRGSNPTVAVQKTQFFLEYDFVSLFQRLDTNISSGPKRQKESLPERPDERKSARLDLDHGTGALYVSCMDLD